jgi:hypothetical protein
VRQVCLHIRNRGLFVFLVYVCVWCTLAIIITMIFAEMLPVDWYMYVCNRQPFWITRKKGRFGISFFFRSSSICIDNHFSLIFFCFYFNYMFNLCVWKEHEKQSDADLSIMASSMSCPLLITKEIVLSRLASPTNQTILSINTYTNLVVLSGSIDVLSILIIYLVTNVLYLIWLQRWKHDEREREKTESKKERNLHQCCRRGCHIIIITITITLPEGFIYHQLQLIRLLLCLATVDLYLDIYSFIHLFTFLIFWYVYLALFIHFDR